MLVKTAKRVVSLLIDVLWFLEHILSHLKPYPNSERQSANSSDLSVRKLECIGVNASTLEDISNMSLMDEHGVVRLYLNEFDENQLIDQLDGEGLRTGNLGRILGLMSKKIGAKLPNIY